MVLLESEQQDSFQCDTFKKNLSNKRTLLAVCASVVLVTVLVVVIVVSVSDGTNSNGGSDDGRSHSDDNLSSDPRWKYVRFSWDTLPVFFHSQNGSGPWNDQAVDAIGRYPLVTFEKAMSAANGRSSDVNGPASCVQIRNSYPDTATLFYLNSVVDWQWYDLHSNLTDHPEWRVKDENDEDILLTSADCWGFNLSISDLSDYWLRTCKEAVISGCSGCFIDRANNMTQLSSTQRMSDDQANQFALAHMSALRDLNEWMLQRTEDESLSSETEHYGTFSVANNQGLTADKDDDPPGVGTTAMMIEDWAGSEQCIDRLKQARRLGLIVEVRAGHYTSAENESDDCGFDNCCDHSDTVALAAFLVGMGNFTFYHCAPWWQSYADWPSVSDFWLDWREEYDYPLGRPLSEASLTGRVYQREFESGTKVTFDAANGTGLIEWANGVTQQATIANAEDSDQGCVWQTGSIF